MEKQIEELTNELHQKCIGKDAGVVIGAAFNIAQTAINAIRDPRVLAAVSATLRSQADAIDTMLTGERH